ncbi:flagellar basal-body rod protein FlgB [Halobacillus alkaliphilus]|uniref:Flagellar basal body rod protein FlgB n=1 Tax=Halobacillus alkaliphilus TaxID=396056 RepID=A0A1I2KUY2_9BACI|nr:flagellar basal-body rod protein FlgB [Halobacillus alkaliphilus]
MLNLFNDTFNTLEKSLNYALEKNRAISNNISNVDTPGYKAKDVVFKDHLNRAEASLSAKKTSQKHIDFQNRESVSYNTTTNNSTTYNHNGNNVDIDKEMSSLAQNQIYYQALADRMSGKFRSMESVIKGGN